MPIDLKNLPSLIAIPYSETLKKDSIQRKDFQRITLENALSLNAIISLANYYEQNRPREEDTQNVKFPELKNFDLGQISVGTWNMFSRESTRAMGANPKALFLNNIYELYHGSKAKEWDDLSGSLISIRNKDAHGELIPADKLGAELDKRQVILDKFVENLSFYNDYKLIVPVKTELVAGRISYNCKCFNGINSDNISISNSKNELELFKVYLYNITSGKSLALSPMLIAYSDKNNLGDYQLYIYSKTSNKSKGNLHYLSLNNSLDLISDDKTNLGQLKSPYELCSDFSHFRIFVEDKSLHDQKKPAITIERKLKNDFVSQDDLIELELMIKNDGELPADDISISFNFPDIFTLCDADGQFIKNKSISELIENNFSLDTGEFNKSKIFFKANDSGQYEFPPITLEYSYEDYQGKIIKPKVEKDGTLINTETSPAIYCTIYDPSDPYSLSPVINVEILGEFGTDEKGSPKKAPYIGEKIKVEVILTNRGFGIAQDIDLTVLTPKEMKLISGNPRWSGNINPSNSITKTFDFECIEPGIQNVNVRELIYSDKDGNLFKTPGGAFNLLVRNNPKIKYERFMAEVWDDLAIDEDELQEIQVLNKKYKDFIPQEEINQIELQTKLKIILKTFREHFEKKGIQMIERPVNEGMLAVAYKTSNCIYAVIDYSTNNSIKIYIKGNLKGQFNAQRFDFNENRNNNMKLKLQYFNLIGLKYDEKIGYEIFEGKINNLKSIIGRTSNWIETHDYLLHSFKDTLSSALGLTNDRISNPNQDGVWVGYYINNAVGERDRDAAIDWYGAFFDEQDNLNVFGQPSNIENMESLSILQEKGYIIKKYIGNDFPVYEDIEKISKKGTYGIQVFKGKVKNIDEVKKNIITNTQQLLLELIRIKNDEILKKLESSSISKDIIEKIIELNNYSNKISSELRKKGLAIGSYFKIGEVNDNVFNATYYLSKDFPLFRDEQDVFSITAKKKKFEIGFRNISDDILDKYKEFIDDTIVIRKHWNKFLVNEQCETEMLKEFIDFAMNNSGQYAYLPNYYLLKAFIENNWSGGLGFYLECLEQNNFNVGYDILVDFLAKNSIDWKPDEKTIKANIRRFKTFKKIFGIDFIYDDNFSERLIAKPEMYEIITRVPKRKKEKEYSELELAQANIKRIILFLNRNHSNGWMKTLNWSGFYWGKRIIFWIIDPKTFTIYNFNNKFTTIEIKTGVSNETQPIIDKILSLKGTIDTLGNMKVIFNEDLSKLGKYGRAWENPPLVTFESNNIFETIEDYSNPDKINRVVEELNLIHSAFLPEKFIEQTNLLPYNAEEYKTAVEEFERAIAAGEIVVNESSE